MKRTSHDARFVPVSPDNPLDIPMTPPVIEHMCASETATRRKSAVSEKLPFELIWKDAERGVWLYHADCLTFMDRVAERHPDGCFDMIFADPPYFLSNGGITCHAGRMVNVDKGTWDRSRGPEENHEFNREWLSRCQRVLKPNGTIWVSGTSHVIHSIGFAMQQLNFKQLNDIVWVKPNPPPNLSCRYFTHATETILWAAKGPRSRHRFNYERMKQVANGKQMKSVWNLPDDSAPDIWEVPPPGRDEKTHGKHPTQKPVALIERILEASTEPGDLVFDPFMGAGTTGVACLRSGRRFVGVELDTGYARQSELRLATARTNMQTDFSQSVASK